MPITAAVLPATIGHLVVVASVMVWIICPPSHLWPEGTTTRRDLDAIAAGDVLKHPSMMEHSSSREVTTDEESIPAPSANGTTVLSRVVLLLLVTITGVALRFIFDGLIQRISGWRPV
ncbi:hypothetical protein BAUCODRAFT_30256 [Baudoinia panamericana UAMH 10762]|uniref:Uncharacterized protein n=1 Tax=Baudoinia panamericana (strain UAMH 10762) TaxID=717646 RepID=M2LYR0_BAUPA|nr:uncharacterized protein BAUCODRAFT_30256 [Baudoinia panamericana UAMH 10762]EMC99842.1 hypothetical protein BAUCODRAFT_30256 [Baudoinia panamericana UAMH 10762]